MESRPARARPAARHPDWWWIFDPRLSLRARAALIFGGGGIAFTVLFSVVAGRMFEASLARQTGATFETMAFHVSDKLDRAIYERYRELQLAASLAPFRADGVPAIERRRLLEAIQDSAPDFAWIGFADARGNVTAATRGIFEGTSVEARPWFRAGRQQSYAAGLHELPALSQALSRSDDDRAGRYLDLAVPVVAQNGQFLGVLAAHVGWEWARDVQAAVVNDTARRQHIGATVYGASGEVLLDSGVSGWTQPPEPPAIADPRRFRGSLVEKTSGGTSYLTGFARSRGHREYRGLGWLTIVRQPVEAALAPARELERRIALWGFAFAATLVVVSWLGAARLARRLRAIGIAADRIREGDVLTVMPRPPGESEIARMCGALGDMVEELREKPKPGAPAKDERPAPHA